MNCLRMCGKVAHREQKLARVCVCVHAKNKNLHKLSGCVYGRKIDGGVFQPNSFFSRGGASSSHKHLTGTPDTCTHRRRKKCSTNRRENRRKITLDFELDHRVVVNSQVFWRNKSHRRACCRRYLIIRLLEEEKVIKKTAPRPALIGLGLLWRFRQNRI